MTAGGLSRKDERLSGGLTHLRGYRDGKGRWRRFPYYYTLLALSEIPGKEADAEIRYAAPGLERMLKRKEGGDRFETRRRALAGKLLARV